MSTSEKLVTGRVLESSVRDALAIAEKGDREVLTTHGKRVDILTSTEVIEVKFVAAAVHAIGQVLDYAQDWPTLQPRVHLFGSTAAWSKVDKERLERMFEEHNVRLTYEITSETRIRAETAREVTTHVLEKLSRCWNAQHGMYNATRFVSEAGKKVSKFRRPGDCGRQLDRPSLIAAYASMRGVSESDVWRYDREHAIVLVSADMIKSIALWIAPEMEAQLMCLPVGECIAGMRTSLDR